jgi:hypothetical protein
MNDSLFASPSCCQLTPNGNLVDSPPRQPVRLNATRQHVRKWNPKGEVTTPSPPHILH